MNATELERLQAACNALLAQQSLLLATRNSEGEADISYAPFVRDGNHFYIFVSELAKHTQNLLRHPHTSILLIEAEALAKNPFARQRLTLRCQVEAVSPNDDNYARQLAALSEKFGETVLVLRSLPDFHLLALSARQGHFVAGFGQAFEVDCAHHFQLQPSRR